MSAYILLRVTHSYTYRLSPAPLSGRILQHVRRRRHEQMVIVRYGTIVPLAASFNEEGVKRYCQRTGWSCYRSCIIDVGTR